MLLLNNEELSKALFARMIAQKRISRINYNQDDVLYILDVIDKVNILDWTACEVDGIPLNKVLIPDCFKFKVMPGRVSFNVSSKYPDLLYIKDIHEVKVDLTRLVNIADCIYGSVKMDTKLVDLGQLRGVVDLNSINYTVCIDGVWRVNGDYTSPYFPIALKEIVAPIIGSHVVNEDAEYLIDEFINQYKIS